MSPLLLYKLKQTAKFLFGVGNLVSLQRGHHDKVVKKDQKKQVKETEKKSS